MVVCFDYFASMHLVRKIGWILYEYMQYYPPYQKDSIFQFLLFQVMYLSKKNTKYKVSK